MIIISIFRVVFIGLLLPAAVFAQSPDPQDAARRVVATTSLAAKEYAEGVVDGIIVAEEEVGEAKLFLAEARAAADGLGPELADVVALIDSLRHLVERVADPTATVPLVDAVLGRIEAVFGDLGDRSPALRPDLAAAAAVYRVECASCHGDRGRGDGALAADLDPAPADLGDPAAMFDQTPLDSYRKISVGVSGTSMPAFEDQLSEEQRWALAWYLQSFRATDAERARGAEVLAVQCPGCGTGGVRGLASLPAELADPAVHSERSDEQLIARLRAAGLGDQPLDSAVAADVTAYLRTLPFAPSGEGVHAAAFGRVRAELARTVREVRAGRSTDADRHAFDAYLAFETIETQVALRDASLSAALEGQFVDFRARAARGDERAAHAAYTALESSLAEAERILAQRQSSAGLLAQSFILLLREGLEAILIVGALAALVVRAGVPERRRAIWAGVGVAGVASIITAILLESVFRLSVAQQELLEGVTMLAATGVLFFVSYWLLSKVEVRHWNAFVKKQVDAALSRGSMFALGLTAFLAVYREGFETVLFYKALYITAEGQGSGAIGLGAAIASVILVALYVGIERFGVRIPLRPFFAVTSAVLLYMAVTFAGKGIAELQESDLVRTTFLDWAPRVPWLGVYPTAQSLALQAALLTLVAAGIVWTFVLEPRYAENRTR